MRWIFNDDETASDKKYNLQEKEINPQWLNDLKIR